MAKSIPVFVKIGSHRALKYVICEIGRTPDEWYSMYRDEHLFELLPAELILIKDRRRIKGVTKAAGAVKTDDRVAYAGKYYLKCFSRE